MTSGESILCEFNGISRLSIVWWLRWHVILRQQLPCGFLSRVVIKYARSNQISAVQLDIVEAFFEYRVMS